MKSKALILSLALAAVAAGCSTEKKVEPAETDDRGIPVDVAAILLSDTCQIDTLYASDDNVVRMINDYDYGQCLIFDSYGLLTYNPVMYVDSVSPGKYKISDLIKEVIVNFAVPEGIEKLKTTFPVYDAFKIEAYGFTESEKQRYGEFEPAPVTFGLVVSAPGKDIEGWEALSKAVAAKIDSVPFDGSFKSLAVKMSRDFFADYGEESFRYGAMMCINSLAYYMNPECVTYFHTYSDYTGGAHGMYGYDFSTYVFDERRFVGNGYLFKPGCDDDLRQLIYEAFAADNDFTSNHSIYTPAQIERYFTAMLDEGINIPEGALVADGVVFCYQPYEIGSYAEGAFQLVVPYEKIKPLLTDKAKHLLK